MGILTTIQIALDSHRLMPYSRQFLKIGKGFIDCRSHSKMADRKVIKGIP